MNPILINVTCNIIWMTHTQDNGGAVGTICAATYPDGYEFEMSFDMNKYGQEFVDAFRNQTPIRLQITIGG